MIHSTIRLFCLYVILTFISNGCSLFDTDRPEVAFLVIDGIEVKTTPNQGPPTHNLKDVWVYADDLLLGVFELPAKIPVIITGEKTHFLVFPGFRNNGENARSFIYRLMKPDDFEVALSVGEEYRRKPVFEYSDQAIFDFVETFESGHIFTLDLDEDSETFIATTEEEAASGQHSGKMIFGQQATTLAAATNGIYQGLTNTGGDSYLELEYKNEIPFVVGALLRKGNITEREPLIVLSPKEDWHKIYIDFTLLLSDSQIDDYRIYFAAESMPLGEKNNVYIDNVKMIHF